MNATRAACGLMLVMSGADALGKDAGGALTGLSLEDLLKVEVSGVSLATDSIAQVPATVWVITAEQIHRRGYLSLIDVLADLPGVDVQMLSSQESENRLAVRGVAGNNKLLILEDGIRINSPTNDEVPMTENYALAHAERIEFIYGPASARYGADAFTGVVNIVTRDPAHAQGLGFTVYRGEHDASYVAAHIGGALSDDLSVSLYAHYHEADNEDLTDSYPDVYPLGDLVTFGGTVAIPASQRSGFTLPTESYSIDLQVHYHDWLRAGYQGNHYRQSTATSVASQSTDYGGKPDWITDMGTAFVQLDRPLGERVTTHVELNHATYEVDPRTKYRNIFVDFQDGYKYAYGEETGLKQWFELNLSTADTFALGYSYERFESIPKTADLSARFDPDGPIVGQPLYYPGAEGALPARIFHEHYDNTAVFGEWRRNWNGKLSSFVGARNDDNSDFGNSFNPRLGLVYQWDARTTLKLLYGEAFLAPAPKLRFEHFGSFAFQRADGVYQSFFFHIPNPDLRPEKMHSLEFSLGKVFSESLFVHAAIYYQEVDDVIAPVPTPTPQHDYIPGGDIVFTEYNQNIGNIKAHGLDTSVRYDRQLARGELSLWGNYSLVDGDQSQLGESGDLSFIARHKAKLGATWSRGNFWLSPAIRWIGHSNGAIPDQGGADSFSRIDLFSGYRLHRSTEVYLRINNLLDTHYENVALGTGNLVAVPQPTRWIQLGVSVQFDG